jgi:hypothetical protein
MLKFLVNSVAGTASRHDAPGLKPTQAQRQPAPPPVPRRRPTLLPSRPPAPLCHAPQSSSPAGCPVSMASSCLRCCPGGAGLIPSPCTAGMGLPPRLSTSAHGPDLPPSLHRSRAASNFLQSIWSPTAAGEVPGPPPDRFKRRPCSRINLTPLSCSWNRVVL